MGGKDIPVVRTLRPCFLFPFLFWVLAGGPLQADPLSPRPPASERIEALLPIPAPAEIMGTEGYYRWRYHDFMRRHPYLREPDPQRIPDYYLAYGEKYVIRFSRQLAPQLSEPGRLWLARVRLGLQMAMEKRRQTDPAAFARLEERPSRFRQFAFETHLAVYMDAGLADLPPQDILKIGATPELKDILRKDGRTQIFAISHRLGRAYLRKVFGLIRRVNENVWAAVRNGDSASFDQTVAFLETLSPADRRMVSVVTGEFREVRQTLRFRESHESSGEQWSQRRERLEALAP